MQAVPIALGGGLNLAVPDSRMDAGQCSMLINYELTTSGRYQRMLGYERFDGRPAPSLVIASSLAGYPFATAEAAIAAIKAAQQTRRQAIQPVPGAGPVLGVVWFKGVLYAFRNTADNTAARMYKATATGWQLVTTPTLSPSGKYEFVEANFKGSAGTRELVGVDGVNKAFRFNGTTFTQIIGPITPDMPTHVEVLASQVLLLSYRGGSFVFSGIGEPTKFSPVDGGGEVAVGSEITGMEMQAENACAILCRDRTYMLYGSSKADFQLKALALRAGAIAGTIQTMGQSIYLDDRGLTRLDRVQQFGNFDSATISQLIQPLLLSKLQSVRASSVVRSKNQYRLYFSDTTGITMTTLGSEIVGFSELYIGFVPSCSFSGENDTGTGELQFMGSDSGYVYQMECGNSHDGAVYSSVMQPAFMSLGSQEQKKRWHKVVLECEAVAKVSASLTMLYDYGDTSFDTAQRDITIQGAGSRWDVSNWDDANWGGSSVAWSDIYIDGVSRNLSFLLQVTDDYYPPHTLSQTFIHASPRARRR